MNGIMPRKSLGNRSPWWWPGAPETEGEKLGWNGKTVQGGWGFALGETFDGNCLGKLPTFKPLTSCCCHRGQCSVNNRLTHKQKKCLTHVCFWPVYREQVQVCSCNPCTAMRVCVHVYSLLLHSCIFHQSAASKEVRKGQWEVDDVLFFMGPVWPVLSKPDRKKKTLSPSCV